MGASTSTSGIVAACLLLAPALIHAYELSENLSASVLAAASVQCQALSRGTADACRGGAPVQAEFSLQLTSTDTFQTKIGIAAGNGLTNTSPFVLSPWAADLRDDVREINSSDRSYLLTAWWRHRFEPTPKSKFSVSLGLIDATDFLDDNAYANDEYSQFMNEALVNGPNAFLPSYDPGGAIEFVTGDWTLRGVAMRLQEDSDSGQFNFFGGQIAYRMHSRVGSGTYRLLIGGTSEDLFDPDGDAKERRSAAMISLDQELGPGWGAFVRIGWQDETAGAGYHAIYSGGLDIKGARWGRTEDNIGLAYALLEGSGDGRLSADLRLGKGRLASGSALEIHSGNLASRFLDFEAKGAGLLKARVTGKASAPGAGIDATISDFQFRRLDETAPYIQGKRLDLKATGKRLDKDNVLRELDTDIQLWEAKIPDITVYNRYLPPDSGVAIVSGKGVVEGGFEFKGVSGSGDLQLRAEGVEVRFQDQRLKGNLLIYTRLRDGDLDAMTFDASGTRVRLDKGSLLTGRGTSGQEWWGQIDLEEGRMTWKQPLELDARVGLQLRDSGLLVNLFVKKSQHQEWLSKLLTIMNVKGEGRVRIRDDGLTLRDVRIAGEDFLVLANARLRGDQVEGGLYAKYGVLGGGVELAGGKSEWRLVNAREWFDGNAKAFSASKR